MVNIFNKNLTEARGIRVKLSGMHAMCNDNWQ